MSTKGEKGAKGEEIPKGQLRMDNLVWLFALSLLISLVVYNAWGLIELLNVPPVP